MPLEFFGGRWVMWVKEKAMAPCSSTLAWRIPWTEEPERATVYGVAKSRTRLTSLHWCCHTSTWIHHGCTCVPKHEPPSHLPPHNISLGHPRAPAPSMLCPASDIDWRFYSYMIVHMFQCHSPKSSHPCPLPQSPKDCSVNLCFFCCLAYRVIVTIFLNFIYMR